MSVQHNLQIIKEKIANSCIRGNRKIDDITIIAVTKYSSIEKACEALDAGVTNLGENRDQEFLHKYEVLKDKPIWHFIGTLQTRKVKNVIDKIDYLHSLDRISLAEEINKRAASVVNCFIQVNVSGEESKHGIDPSELMSFLDQLKLYPKVKIIGLMTMAPNTDDHVLIRNCFRKLKQLQLRVQELNLDYAPCTELSMGMSNDYEIAIEEGATMIRIGTALVGEN